MVTKAIQKHTLKSILRVDHAGEYGAVQIYKGQKTRLKDDQQIQHMYEQELMHLEYFEQELLRQKIRPTLLMPLWQIGSFVLGVVSARFGQKAAMRCTQSVEKVIVAHYDRQLELAKEYDLPQELTQKIQQFNTEEQEHHDVAQGHLARTSSAFGMVVQGICKCAIWLSKKL